MSVDTALCECGHPRHRHEYLSEFYPAICSHVEPRPAGLRTNADGEPLEGVCLCLHFAEPA